VKAYRTIRAEHPDPKEMSDKTIFKLMVAARYAAIPHRKAEALLEEYLKSDLNLEALIVCILAAENGLENSRLPLTFHDAIKAELKKEKFPPYNDY